MTFETDRQAEKYLRDHGFEIIRGMIIHSDRFVTDKETAAINYLCAEWDLGYTRDPGEIYRLRRKVR